MNNCADNAFCRRLPEDVRDRLCKHCIKTSFAEGTRMPIDVNHPWLILDGLLLTMTDNHPVSIIGPGEMLLTPRFTPEQVYDVLPESFNLTKDNQDYVYTCFTPLFVATFSVRAIEETMQDVRFLRVLFDATSSQNFQTQIFQRYLYQKSAYNSVRYVLQLARHYGITGLTHEKIARLTGRNRTTVTQTLHQIALAEPELVEGL